MLIAECRLLPARNPKRLLDQRRTRRSQQASVVVQYNLDRHLLQQALHASFLPESLQEGLILHLRQDLRRDAPPDKHPASGHKFQRAVAGFASIDAYKYG